MSGQSNLDIIDTQIDEFFDPKTEKIRSLCSHEFCKSTLLELKQIFDNDTNVYIDYANVWHWFDNLDWKISLKRMYQFFTSFKKIKKIYFYHGTLENSPGDLVLEEARKCGYSVVTKPVKIMPLNIDMSELTKDSPVRLRQFIRASLLRKLNPVQVEYLNGILKDFNKLGQKAIEERKCNFDVEISRDILMDEIKGNCANFVIMSGDTDFAPIAEHLTTNSRKVTIFHMSGKLSPELAEVGAKRFRVHRIRDFICRNKDIKPQALL